MLKYIFAFIILIHGFIHFIGFAKGFNIGDMKQLTMPISKPIGLLWMVVAFLFIFTTILFLLKNEYWWIIAIIAVVCSQIVIVMSWMDAKFGTMANLIVLLMAVLSFTTLRFEKMFWADVVKQFHQNNTMATPLITKADLAHLPLPVQQYLNYCDVVNKPKVKNMRIVLEGEMRSNKKDWFPFTSVQYNFLDEPTRLFFMKGKMLGLTIPGYHHYINKRAVMDIRLFGLKKMVYMQGAEMNKAETVTLFNDMCLMAPASLIDKRISWEPIDSRKAKAVFNNGNISITAILHFDKEGKLVDFTSNDRYDVNERQWIPFSTPVKEYQIINGMKIISYGEATWQYSDGNFTYGRFRLKEVEYNLEVFKN